MWLTAVITCKDSPLTSDCYVFLEILPLHRHMTVFVGTKYKFENTRYQMFLLHKQNKIHTSVMVLFHVFCNNADYLFVPQFTSPVAIFNWTLDGERKNLPFRRLIRENILKQKKNISIYGTQYQATMSDKSS